MNEDRGDAVVVPEGPKKEGAAPSITGKLISATIYPNNTGLSLTIDCYEQKASINVGETVKVLLVS